MLGVFSFSFCGLSRGRCLGHACPGLSRFFESANAARLFHIFIPYPLGSRAC